MPPGPSSEFSGKTRSPLLQRFARKLSWARLRNIKTYSQDLRERMLAAVHRGMPEKEAVRTFGVSLATVKRWLNRTTTLSAFQVLSVLIPQLRVHLSLRLFGGLVTSTSRDPRFACSASR